MEENDSDEPLNDETDNEAEADIEALCQTEVMGKGETPVLIRGQG